MQPENTHKQTHTDRGRHRERCRSTPTKPFSLFLSLSNLPFPRLTLSSLPPCRRPLPLSSVETPRSPPPPLESLAAAAVLLPLPPSLFSRETTRAAPHSRPCHAVFRHSPRPTPHGCVLFPPSLSLFWCRECRAGIRRAVPGGYGLIRLDGYLLPSRFVCE